MWRSWEENIFNSNGRQSHQPIFITHFMTLKHLTSVKSTNNILTWKAPQTYNNSNSHMRKLHMYYTYNVWKHNVNLISNYKKNMRLCSMTIRDLSHRFVVILMVEVTKGNPIIQIQYIKNRWASAMRLYSSFFVIWYTPWRCFTKRHSTISQKPLGMHHIRSNLFSHLSKLHYLYNSRLENHVANPISKELKLSATVLDIACHWFFKDIKKDKIEKCFS